MLISEKAISEPYSFMYIDKPRKFTAKNFQRINYVMILYKMSYSNGILGLGGNVISGSKGENGDPGLPGI